LKNSKKRHLTHDEVKTLIAACDKTDYPSRNKAVVMLAFRHGFRATELCRLKWTDIDTHNHTVYIVRSKGGLNTTQPMQLDELKMLNDWRRERRVRFPSLETDEIFLSQRNTQFTRIAFNQLMAMLGKKAGLDFKPFPHMLRHACGYHLVNQGCDIRLIQDYLGHRSLNGVIGYTKINPARFKTFKWD